MKQLSLKILQNLENTFARVSILIELQTGSLQFH